MSDILGEALERYLSETGSRLAITGVVAESWGVLKLDRRKVDRLTQEEDSLLDA